LTELLTGLDLADVVVPGTTFDRSWRELAVTKQVNLVLANMFWAEAIGRTVEVLREIFYRVNSGDHIFPITSRFPSGTGGYPPFPLRPDFA
jgi:hypothetical protein